MYSTARRTLAAAGFLCLIVLSHGCATLRTETPRSISVALEDAAGTPLARAFDARARAHPGLSGFHLLTSGQAALVGRVALADLATRTLDLQYFSVGDDLTTDLLLERLQAAARRGVRVRILVDDTQPQARRVLRLAARLHPGIQARLFNPFRWADASVLPRLLELASDAERLNQRMHNKMWVADNVLAVYGSRNLGDAYFDVDRSDSFLDIDLLTAGPVVKTLSRSFDAYWNSTQSWPIEAFGNDRADRTADDAAYRPARPSQAL